MKCYQNIFCIIISILFFFLRCDKHYLALRRLFIEFLDDNDNDDEVMTVK